MASGAIRFSEPGYASGAAEERADDFWVALDRFWPGVPIAERGASGPRGGRLEMMPVIGPLSSAALVGIVALQQGSLYEAALLVGFVIGLRLSIDNLVGPLVLGQAARLHPVVIIAAFVYGAMLFGVLGLLLAVPAAMCVKIGLEHYYAEPICPKAEC